MSTHQPPGGQQPDGTPAYTQPQDPWAGGFEPGLASVPTDPIPGGYQQGDVWSQQTVAHPGQYTYQEPPRSKAGLFAMVFVLVLVLGGGGGFAAWWLVDQRNKTTTTTSPTASVATELASCPIGAEAGAFDPCKVKKGDCLVNEGTENSPRLVGAQCNTDDALEIVKISRGPEIPKNSNGSFDREATSVVLCQGSGYDKYYARDSNENDLADVVLCLTYVEE